ncbi:MAG: site-2 protease family protein, partial [Candidatus Omnitrophica bacterium]|nr:site-2 protease family protein [Candidatus Omnitrophota bacterium]
TGPIGIFMLTGEAARMGIVYLIHLLGVLSLSLAIFNLFPIPVLDGGHVLFLVLERMRGGRPVTQRWQIAATKAGLAALLLLVGVIFYSDLARYGVAEKLAAWWSRKP